MYQPVSELSLQPSTLTLIQATVSYTTAGHADWGHTVFLGLTPGPGITVARTATPVCCQESTPGLCCHARETGSPGSCPQCIHPLLRAGTGYQRMLPGSETRSKGWAGISSALCGLGSMGPEKSVWLEFWEPAAYASCHSLMKPAGNSRNPRQWSRGSVVRLNEATFENAQHGILPRAPGRGSQTTPPLLTQGGGHG